jgi:ribulose-phosphate 3-epimerase
MKTEIIPTILVKSFKEIKERVELVEKYVKRVQLDVMDGIFVDNETWPYEEKGKPRDLKKIKTKLNFEIHLMVQEPEKVIDEWLKVADRVIIHFESKITNREYGIRNLIEKVHKQKKEIGLALNPETHYAVATPFLKDLDLVQVMTVQPGWGGQEFREWVLAKIEFLRKFWPQGNIEVDGGINDENIKRVFKAGANLFGVGTRIYKSKNIEKTIKGLEKLIK